MAVKLRLTRVGKTKQPQYRIVAADSRSPRDGRFIEIVGHYNPRTDPSTLSIDHDKAAKWLRQGAQPTDRVRKLLQIAGVARPVRPRRDRRMSERVFDDDSASCSMSAADVAGNGALAPTAAAVLTHVVRSIVDDPDAVQVDASEGRGRVRLDVRVGPGDLGRVIGRRGRTAQSIRTVVRAAASATTPRSTSSSSTIDRRHVSRPPGLLEIGHLRRAHGIRGQINVQLTTDRPERLTPGARWYARDGWLTVAAASPHHDRWLVTFDEIDDRVSAQRYTNTPVFAEAVDDDTELWVHELIGTMVVDTAGVERGRCVAVIANPAADLLELEGGALVPVVFVVERTAERVVVDPPAGLFELYDS